MTDTIWESYKRGVATAPKPRRKTRMAKPEPDQTAVRQAAAASPVILPNMTDGVAVKHDPRQALERKREKSLRQGDIRIDAKLDLHGLTQAQAFAALASFMTRVTTSGQRHLLIVTGKGRAGGGILRANCRKPRISSPCARPPPNMVATARFMCCCAERGRRSAIKETGLLE